MRSDARKRATDPEAYAWPDSSDLHARLCAAEAALGRVRELMKEWEAEIDQPWGGQDICLDRPLAEIREALDGTS